MPAVATVQANSAQKILDAARSRGVSTEELLGAVGLTSEMLADSDGRIPFRALARLYDEVAARVGDDAFGLRVGAATHPRMFDVLGYAAMACASIGDAFGVITRYYRVLQEGAVLEVARDRDTATIRYRVLDPTLGSFRHETESSLAIVLRFLEAARGGTIEPIEVRFTHREPARTDVHREVFGRTPRFGCAANELVVASALLDSPIATADPALGAVLRRHLEAQLAKLPEEADLPERVRRVVVAELHRGVVTTEFVSRRLGMSERSLQRHLAAASSSFGALLDDVRRTLASRYLVEPSMSIADVAFALGYSDLPSFYRAHRRWTGTTPARIRERGTRREDPNDGSGRADDDERTSAHHPERGDDHRDSGKPKHIASRRTLGRIP